jgi:hypothetical protein
MFIGATAIQQGPVTAYVYTSLAQTPEHVF